jgi:hypothetical protein
MSTISVEKQFQGSQILELLGFWVGVPFSSQPKGLPPKIRIERGRTKDRAVEIRRTVASASANCARVKDPGREHELNCHLIWRQRRNPLADCADGERDECGVPLAGGGQARGEPLEVLFDWAQK